MLEHPYSKEQIEEKEALVNSLNQQYLEAYEILQNMYRANTLVDDHNKLEQDRKITPARAEYYKLLIVEGNHVDEVYDYRTGKTSATIRSREGSNLKNIPSKLWEVFMSTYWFNQTKHKFSESSYVLNGSGKEAYLEWETKNVSN